MKDKDGKEDAKEARVADNALPPWFYLFVLLGLIERPRGGPDCSEPPVRTTSVQADFAFMTFGLSLEPGSSNLPSFTSTRPDTNWTGWICWGRP